MCFQQLTALQSHYRLIVDRKDFVTPCVSVGYSKVQNSGPRKRPALVLPLPDHPCRITPAPSLCRITAPLPLNPYHDRATHHPLPPAHPRPRLSSTPHPNAHAYTTPRGPSQIHSPPTPRRSTRVQIGRASCREKVELLVGAVAFKKKKDKSP